MRLKQSAIIAILCGLLHENSYCTTAEDVSDKIWAGISNHTQAFINRGLLASEVQTGLYGNQDWTSRYTDIKAVLPGDNGNSHTGFLTDATSYSFSQDNAAKMLNHVKATVIVNHILAKIPVNSGAITNPTIPHALADLEAVIAAAEGLTSLSTALLSSSIVEAYSSDLLSNLTSQTTVAGVLSTFKNDLKRRILFAYRNISSANLTTLAANNTVLLEYYNGGDHGGSSNNSLTDLSGSDALTTALNSAFTAYIGAPDSSKYSAAITALENYMQGTDNDIINAADVPAQDIVNQIMLEGPMKEVTADGFSSVADFCIYLVDILPTSDGTTPATINTSITPPKIEDVVNRGTLARLNEAKDLQAQKNLYDSQTVKSFKASSPSTLFSGYRDSNDSDKFKFVSGSTVTQEWSSYLGNASSDKEYTLNGLYDQVYGAVENNDLLTILNTFYK